MDKNNYSHHVVDENNYSHHVVDEKHYSHTMWWMKVNTPTYLIIYLFNVCENSYSHTGGGIDTVDLVWIF